MPQASLPYLYKDIMFLRTMRTQRARLLQSSGVLIALMGCAQAPFSAQASLSRCSQVLALAQEQAPSRNPEVARHLALAAAQFDQAHALAAQGQEAAAALLAERAGLDAELALTLAQDESDGETPEVQDLSQRPSRPF